MGWLGHLSRSEYVVLDRGTMVNLEYIMVRTASVHPMDGGQRRHFSSTLDMVAGIHEATRLHMASRFSLDLGCIFAFISYIKNPTVTILWIPRLLQS